MTRITSLFAATTLAILPISAFAQQDTAPAKTAAPNAVISPAPANSSTPLAGKTADGKSADGKTTATIAPANTAAMATQPAKHDGKTNMSGGKAAMHGVNGTQSHDSKTATPATGKTAEPTKS
jgi:hypothetical protein